MVDHGALAMITLTNLKVKIIDRKADSGKSREMINKNIFLVNISHCIKTMALVYSLKGYQ